MAKAIFETKLRGSICFKLAKIVVEAILTIKRKDEIFDTKGSFGFLDEIISGRKKNYILMINYPYIKSQSPKEILDFDLDLFQDGSKLAEFNYKIDFE
jgi:hypothetical protein